MKRAFLWEGSFCYKKKTKRTQVTKLGKKKDKTHAGDQRGDASGHRQRARRHQHGRWDRQDGLFLFQQ